MKSLKQMRLGTRLIAGFLSLVTVGGVVAAVGIWGLRQMNETNDRLYDRELLAISHVKEANINLIYAGRARLSFAAAGSEAERASAAAVFRTAVGDATQWLQKAKPLFVTAEGQRRFALVEADLAAYTPSVEAYLKAASARALATTDDELRGLDQRAREASKRVDDELTALTKLKEEQGRKAAENGTELYTRLSALMIALTLASAIGGLAVGVLLTRSVTRRLGGEPEDVAAAAQAIADGDLGQTIDVSRAAPGSIVRAMHDMQQALRRLVGQVRHSSENIATASTQIASGNADLSQRTEEQASNLQQTAASMEQLTGTVKSNADTAQQASQLANSASAVATEGGTAVSQVVATMEDISASSRKIADIIGVIDGIAFQTNILALNAAVEAARAGEQGRGFAVVAGEVRTLAQRSAQAAREIKTLINDSVEKVETGGRLVDGAGRTMEQIVAQVRRVNDLISEMSASTQEQSTGIGQVGSAVSQLDQVTQQNAALVEESAAAADSLNQQAQQLVRAIGVFRLGDEASGSQRVASPTHASAAPASARTSRPTTPAPVRPAGVGASPARTAPAREDADWAQF